MIFFFHFWLLFLHEKQKTLLLFSSQSPNNNKKGGLDFFHSQKKKRRKSSGGREDRDDDDDAVRRLLLCFDEISFVSFCAMLFRYFICVSLQIFKNQTNHFKSLILSTVAHWRRITRRSVYDHRSFLPPLKGITTERVLRQQKQRQQNFVVVVKKGRR